MTAAIAAAQAPDAIKRVEERIAAHPANVPDRVALLRALANPAVPLETARAERRTQILWLIEHQPESRILEQPPLQLYPSGRLGDPEGFEQARTLWLDLAAKPGATSKTIASAALFFETTDPEQGFAILDHAGQDPDLERARGILRASVMLGVSGVEDSGNVIRLATSEALRRTPAAAEARKEIEASKDANLIGAAGAFISSNGLVAIPYDLTFGDDDVPTLAEKWLRRARELVPSGDEWNAALASAMNQESQRTLDPGEKVRLLSEASDLLPASQKPGLRPAVLNAEFAAGDDAAAARDAQALADAPRNASDYNLGETILGRLALAHGDAQTAKEMLMASLKPPAKFRNPVFEPNMTLAQDIFEAGDRDTVVAFLEASRAVWKFDRGRIDRMIGFVKKAPSADLVQLSRQLPGGELLHRPAPAFEAQEDVAGKVVALEFGSAPAAEKAARDRGVVLLHIEDKDIWRRFEVQTDPTLVVLDRQGNVAAFRSGAATEAEWKSEIQAGFERGSNPAVLPAPKQIDDGEVGALAWEPVERAESYVVEWDSYDQGEWGFDRDRSVRVIPTRETSTVLDLKGLTRIRWRVYAVPKNGPPGQASAWREIDTKVYK